MTVLTFPSVGAKSDKAPLIGDNEVHNGQTPPPPYHPKSLEAGDGDLPNGRGRCIGIRIVPRYKPMVTVLVSLLMLIFLVIFVLCKIYVHDVPHKPIVDTEDDSAMPSKSYSSYAAAESDMLLLPPPSPPRRPKNLIISLLMKGTADKAPQIIINKSARFLYDFSINITGIIDFENERCYVMPLLRNNVGPPQSLYDMLIKISSGYYSMDINNVLSNFHMVQPAISDLSDYGMYISKDCANYSTFKLEKDVATDSP